MATEEPQQPEMQIPLSWVNFNETPIAFANQVVCQFQPNEFVVTFGQATGPPLIGTPEEVQEQAKRIEFVPIRTLVRLGMSRARLIELIGVLQANLENHDRAMEAADPR